MRQRNILVAVDFGTTLSGVAYSDPDNGTTEAEPVLFNQWKYECDKIPTKIQYEGNLRGNGAAQFGRYKWGDHIKDGQACHKWFKLKLDSGYLSGSSSAAVDMSREYQDENGDENLPTVPAERLTTDFLRAVREHVEHHLGRVYRSNSGEVPRFKWIITVPTVWSTEARNATRDCARGAGMAEGDDLLMTSEPEAAFIYAAKTLPARHKEVGKNIIILDAGGGTVDLVTYRIREVQPFLKVEENLVPNGGKCGSVFVNRVFEKMIDNKLRNHRPPLSMPSDTRRTMMSHFELMVKRRFDGEDTEENLPVPNLPDNDSLRIRGGHIEISTSEMIQILDEVVNNVLQLTTDQVNGVRSSGGNVSAIILVGGFGASPYLKKRLETDPSLRDIEVCRCRYPDTAVVRGAVIEGLQRFVPHKKTVHSRKSVCSLAISSSMPFRPGYHPEENKYQDPLSKEFLCRDVLSYFVKKNDDLREDVPVIFSFDRLVPIEGPFNFQDFIYETYEDIPPIIENEKCRVLGTIDSDMSGVGSYHFDRPGSGDYFRIRYTITAVFSAVDVQLQLSFNGSNYGTAKLRYGNSAMFRPIRRA